MKKVLFLALLLVSLLATTSCILSEIEADISNSSESQQENELLYEDNYIKVSYVETFEEKSITGCCYLRLLVENNSDKKVTIYPEDASVNGFSITIGSGLPMEIQPGNKSQQPFIVFYASTDVTQLSDITSIKFKLNARDDDFESVTKTDELEINF